MDAEKDRQVISPRGGETFVSVLLPSGHEVNGNAVCSKHDVYNKKLGVKIALGRAIKQLSLKDVERSVEFGW